MDDAIEVKVGRDGRVRIPAEIRRAAHFETGTVLLVRMEGDHVILIPRDAIKRRLRDTYAGIEGSMADELMSERHRAAAIEDDDEQ